MKRRKILELAAVSSIILAAPAIAQANSSKNYKGKHGSFNIEPTENSNAFNLSIAGNNYVANISRGGLNGLKAALKDGEHKITVDGDHRAFSIRNGKVTIDLDKIPVIEPIPKHIGPAGGVILIILIIYGKWPPKPGRKKVKISLDGAEIDLSLR